MIDMTSPSMLSDSSDPLDCCAPVTVGVFEEATAQDLASVFAALSDPVRLRLLSIVAFGGEVCSCNLEGPLNKRQSTISHHTSVLSNAGLITGTRRGRWMYWRVVPERLALIARVLDPALGLPAEIPQTL
jgi:ArsR family transcriptional regulator